MRERDWEVKGLGGINGVPGERRVIVRRDAIIRSRSFRAEAGNVYAVDTTDGTFTAYLPKVANDQARVSFYGNWGQLVANPLTVDAEQNQIVHGTLAAAQTLDFDEDSVLLTFVWSAADKQWRTYYG